MRLLPALAVLGLFLAPLAAAQPGPGPGDRPGSPPPSDGPGDPRARECAQARNETAKRDCVAAYCEAHPGSDWCKANCPHPEARCARDGGEAGFQGADKPPRCDPPREGCPPDCQPQPPEPGKGKGNRSADPAPSSGRPACKSERVDGLKWIRFSLGADRATLLNYTVDGRLALDRLHLEGVGTLRIERRGSLVRATDGDTSLVLHDEPNGLVHFEGDDNATAILAFPPAARVERGEDGARILYPDGVRGLLRGNLSWASDRDATASGFFSFHVPPAARGGGGDDGERGKRDPRIDAAIERRRVGAEVVVRPATNQTPLEVLSYDDVEAEARLPPGHATPDAPIRITLSSNLTSGRTVVLKLDSALLSSLDPERLVLQYYDLHSDGTQTEVEFGRASSLDDVLDPTDDGGQPEFYAVSDANGLQVLVSVPRWSDHLVTLGSLGDIVKPGVLLGLAAGIAATVLAAVALFVPRRRRE